MTTNNSKEHPDWYKDAIIYQVHVRSFYDSSGNGIGDFNGLIQKLDYIQRLGVNTIWLLPFYPSPLKDGGYDIADFKNINPEYGTLADFKRFVKEAHSRGLRVITELVLNHTSTQHKWFQRARRAKPGSAARNYYVWSETPDKYTDARIIFQDFEDSNWTYDHQAKAYYWHRFYSHQPDLNFENPKVQEEIFSALDFWFKMGVDGFRLDAVPYLYQAEGTNCENLPQTHVFLKKLRKYVDQRYKNRLLLAEANQWPEDASAYFGKGDECHMAFHFPLMPRLYMALRMEDRFPVVDILEQTPSIPDNCQWAIFLRNHDELTLEMVSDEERDYMYRAFAEDPRKRVNVGIRRRLFPLLGGDFRNIELLNVLLMSMPGTPVIYYGDEIGMGDNYYLGDRDGMRTPMQWTPDKNAGFSKADPQRLFLPVVIDSHYHYTAVNVENQERNPSSFLWWQRRVVAKRKQYKAFGRGSIRFVSTSNPKVLAFVRCFEEESILVVINLSRYAQYVELDLSNFLGYTPIEAFSRNRFPVIGERPWPISMQFKNYFWFELNNSSQREKDGVIRNREPLIFSSRQWKEMGKDIQTEIATRLFNYLVDIQWFKGDERKLRNVNVLDVLASSDKNHAPYYFMVQLDMIEGRKDIYFMPLSLALNDSASDIQARYSRSVIAPVLVDGQAGILYDGAEDVFVSKQLFNLIASKSRLTGKYQGSLSGKSGRLLKKMHEPGSSLTQHTIPSRYTNSSVVFGDQFFLKVYRSPQEGENPDVELMEYLSRKVKWDHVPPYLGRLYYNNSDFKKTSIALLMGLIPNVGSAWQMTHTAIEDFFDEVLSSANGLDKLSDEEFVSMVGPFFLEMTQLLGRRTAEMHLALAENSESEDFKPESFSLLYQKSLYQSLRTFIRRSLGEVKQQMDGLPSEFSEGLTALFDKSEAMMAFARSVLEAQKLPSKKMRIHGNYKLDKILFTGKDFMMINFEGELELPLSVRRIKHSPLKDVATMLNSLHYAAHQGYLARKEFASADKDMLLPLLDRWVTKVGDVFMCGYMEAMGSSNLIPKDRDKMEALLDVFKLEKAVSELKQFVNSEHASIHIPLKIIDQILEK